MATHFMRILSRLGWMRVPGPARTPLSMGLLWLGWLASCAQPWLGLAWACLACLALAWSSNNRPLPAAGGGFACCCF